MSRQLLSEIKSMMELHLTVEQIAHRLCLNVHQVSLAINRLKTS
jgi:hypothetical protein